MTDENRVRILSRTGTHGNKSAGLENLVKSRAVHYQILDNREGCASERFDRNGGAILEVTHEKLAGRDAVVRTMSAAIYKQTAGTADTFAAIMVEGDRTGTLAAAFNRHGINALADKLFIKDIQHLQEGGIAFNTRNMISLEMTLGLGVFLTPYLEIEFHNLILYSYGSLPL